MAELNYTVQNYFEVNKIYSELSLETSGMSETAEAIKFDYLHVYFKNKITPLPKDEFALDLTKSHDEFIDKLLNEPLSKDGMLRRLQLNSFFTYRLSKRAESNDLFYYGDFEKTLNEGEKFLISSEDTFHRYSAVEQLYLILHPKKDKKKEKYLEFYGETKSKIEKLNEAKNKILDKFSPTAVKVYVGIILAAILFIVLTVLGVTTPFLTSLGEDAYIQTAIISSFIFSAYVFFKETSCGLSVVALIVSIIGAVFCEQIPHVFFCILAGLIILFFISCILSEIKRYRYHKSAQSTVDKDELFALYNKDIRSIKIITELLKAYLEFADTVKFLDILYTTYNRTDDEDEEENKPPKVTVAQVKKDIAITKSRASDIIKYYEKALEEYKSAESKMI